MPLDEQVNGIEQTGEDEINYEKLARSLLKANEHSFRMAQAIHFAESKPLLPHAAYSKRRFYELSLQCSILQMCEG